jgi:SAM-dependent methyltransferase
MASQLQTPSRSDKGQSTSDTPCSSTFYLNLGCGQRLHPRWVNIDITSGTPGVVRHDLRKGIPFPDESCGAVYHSHLLEHLPKEQALAFLRECHRVLQPGGIVRAAVPDLEQIVRCYLSCLEQMPKAQDSESGSNYEWILLELYDQAVRTQSGGQIARYLSQPSIPNFDFVIQRVGWSAVSYFHNQPARSYRDRMQAFIQQRGLFLALQRIALRLVTTLRDNALKVLLRSDFEKLQLGRFRSSGEIHQWMYDRYSLKMLLEQAGFFHIRTCKASESEIRNWPEYCLDTDADGRVYKPDSLYMEATTPPRMHDTYH